MHVQIKQLQRKCIILSTLHLFCVTIDWRRRGVFYMISRNLLTEYQYLLIVTGENTHMCESAEHSQPNLNS